MQSRSSIFNRGHQCAFFKFRQFLAHFVNIQYTIPLSARASFVDGIRLKERQFEELISNRSNGDISCGINEDLAPDIGDDDVPKQIARCNLPGRLRSNRIVKIPARLYDYP